MHIFASLLTVYLTFSSVVASPLYARNVQIKSRALTKPPIPSVSELKTHLLTPERNDCMFFTGKTMVAAQAYADDNNKFLLGDLDKDGWAAPNDKNEFSDDCPLSFKFQEPYLDEDVGWGQSDLDGYWDNMSQAFTEICSGTILLAIPPSAEIPPDSVFARIEWPTIRAGGEIDRIDVIKLGTGEADGTALSAPFKLWERCE